jgi:hypothetical protein
MWLPSDLLLVGFFCHIQWHMQRKISEKLKVFIDVHALPLVYNFDKN